MLKSNYFLSIITFVTATFFISVFVTATEIDKTVSIKDVLKILKTPKMSLKKKFVSLKIMEKLKLELSKSDVDSLKDYLLNPSYGFDLNVYREVVSILISNGVYSKSFKVDLEKSMFNNLDCSEYAAAILDLLNVLGWEIREDSTAIDTEKGGKKHILNYYSKIVSVYVKSDYKVLVAAVRNGSVDPISMSFLSPEQQKKAISVLAGALSNSSYGVGEILEFLKDDVHIPFIPSESIPVLIKISDSSTEDKNIKDSIDYILSGITYVVPSVAGWNEWWNQNKKSFDRRTNAVNALTDKKLPTKIKVLALMYLVEWPVKKLPDAVLMKVLDMTDELHGEEDLKNLLSGIFFEYNKKIPGNSIVNRILKKVSK